MIIIETEVYLRQCNNYNAACSNCQNMIIIETEVYLRQCNNYNAACINCQNMIMKYMSDSAIIIMQHAATAKNTIVT